MDKKLIQCKMVAPQKVRVRSVLLNPTNESFAYWPRYLCVCFLGQKLLIELLNFWFLFFCLFGNTLGPFLC